MATGIAVGISTFGAVNNSINTFYYNNISDGESDLEVGKEDIPYSERKGDYVDRYVSRWERLDYAKKAMQNDTYNQNAQKFYGEYSLHMYLWYAVKDFQGKGIWIADRIGRSAIHAHVVANEPDEDWKVDFLTAIVGFLGI